jgi:pimeloyl-ACP methyl ester carboxylesterase
MGIENIIFTNRSGQSLSGRLDLPEETPQAYALFAHCFTCSKNLKAVAHISKALNGEGIAVLRFDFTGLGESEGDFGDTNFSSNVSDLIDAANYLAQNHTAPRILIGHSLGGAAVLQAAAELKSVKAVVVIGTPAEPTHVKRALAGVEDEIEQKGEAEVDLSGRRFKIKKQFLDDLEKNKMAKIIRKLKRALLILHSPTDSVVGIDNAAKIFAAARHPKSFVSLDRADHLLSDSDDSRYAGKLIAVWAKRYLS